MNDTKSITTKPHTDWSYLTRKFILIRIERALVQASNPIILSFRKYFHIDRPDLLSYPEPHYISHTNS
jgi:hypothetical protein